MRYFLLILVVIPHFIFGQDYKNVELVDHWTDSSLIAGPENARYNDLWSFKWQNEAYCVIGSTMGTHFFSVSNSKLNELDFKPGAFQGYTVIHRDFKIYQNYLYAVCDEGDDGLQIFDISNLPDSATLVYESNTLFQSCHNIFIDTLNSKLYACGPDNIGMKIYDLTDPINPVLDYEFTNVNYVHDCYVRNDTAFLNCGYDGLHIYNFSGAIPIQLGVLDFYPEQGYNHSGWLSPLGAKYAFIDETEGTKVKLCYTSNLSQIQVNQQFASPKYEDNVPHNVVMLDQLAIVSYYNEGLRIFDTGLSPIQEIGHYDTFENDTPYKLNGAWGVAAFSDLDLILISDRQSGLYLFHFPIQVFEGGVAGTFVTSTPFIDENSVLISRNHFQDEELFFTIATINGKIIYSGESYNNWVNIPLDLASGIYVYSIFNKDRQLLESGKFAKAN